MIFEDGLFNVVNVASVVQSVTSSCNDSCHNGHGYHLKTTQYKYLDFFLVQYIPRHMFSAWDKEEP